MSLDALYDANYKDKVVSGKYSSNRKISASLAVIHYAVVVPTPGKDTGIEWLSNYFVKGEREVSTTFCADVDGRVYRTLSLDRTPWCNGTGSLIKNTKISNRYSPDNLQGGWWTDHTGKLSNLVNDMAVTFETVLWSAEVPEKDKWKSIPTNSLYDAIARRIHWCAINIKDFRIWRIVGHEHIACNRKIDPGVCWDWEVFCLKWLGMKKDFFDTYMKFLDETKHLPATQIRKREICIENALKQGKDLLGKDSSFALK